MEDITAPVVIHSAEVQVDIQCPIVELEVKVPLVLTVELVGVHLAQEDSGIVHLVEVIQVIIVLLSIIMVMDTVVQDTIDNHL